MATDYQDWQPYAGLITAIQTLDTDIKALTAGFGSGTTILSSIGTIITLGGPVIVLPAVAVKTHYVVSAFVAWWSNAGDELRGYIRIGISIDNGTSYVYVTLTPEYPDRPILLGTGVPASAANQPVYAQGFANAGASNTTDTQLAVSLVYYDK